jgi:hypothetical protein
MSEANITSLKGQYHQIYFNPQKSELRGNQWYLVNEAMLYDKESVIFVPPPSNASDERKIIHYIALDLPSFPDEHISIHQYQHWLFWKEDAIRLAKCFSGNTDALKVDLKQGFIDKYQKELLWLHAKFYRNLWELIKFKWEPLSFCLKEFWSMEYESARELFCEILQLDIDGDFSFCLKQHYEENVRKVRDLSTLNRKRLDKTLSLEEAERFQCLQEKLILRNLPRERVREVFTGDKRDPFVEASLSASAVYEKGISKLLEKIFV